MAASPPPSGSGLPSIVVEQAKEAVDNIKKGKSPKGKAKVANVAWEAAQSSSPSGSSAGNAPLRQSDKDSNAGERQTLHGRDFFWDEWLSYIASAIVALAIVDLSVEFLTGSRLGATCFTPFGNESFNRDQSAFVNDFCSRYLPDTQFYPLFMLIQGIVIYVPHYVWVSWFSGYFQFFFALAGTLDRHRLRDTGEYSASNVTVVKRLELEFCGRWSLSLSYSIKLAAQAVVALGMISITFIVFYDFRDDITCPPNDTNPPADPSPLFGRAYCVYSRFRYLRLLQVVNVIFLVIAFVIAVSGEMLTFFRSYSDVLGYVSVASFMYDSALNVSHFVLKYMDIACRCPKRSCVHVRSDLDFLLVKLFETDTGFGKLFKDVQVSIETSKKLEAAYQYLYVNYSMGKQSSARGKDLHSSKEMASPMEVFVGDVCQFLTGSKGVCGPMVGEKSNRAAIDISFRPHGFAFTIAEHFEAVAAVFLDEHYQNEKEVVNFRKYSSNMHSLQVPTNILSLPVEKALKFNEVLMNRFLDRLPESKYTPTYKINFILVSGVDNQNKESTVSQLIETFSGRQNRNIADNSVLLVLTPVSIEGSAPKGFSQLQPMKTSHYWDGSYKQEIMVELRNLRLLPRAVHYEVTTDDKVELKCGSTSCVYELAIYKYVSEGVPSPSSGGGDT